MLRLEDKNIDIEILIYCLFVEVCYKYKCFNILLRANKLGFLSPASNV